MSDSSKWLAQQIKEQAAAFATAAAIFAASSDVNAAITMPLVAAGLAGTAAVLTAAHKALKCDEYQAECLRLSQAYHGIAIEADSALSSLEKEPPSLQELTRKFADLTASAKAPLPDKYIALAEGRTNYKLYGQRAPNAGAETLQKTEI
jgi:hypothetical protein